MECPRCGHKMNLEEHISSGEKCSSWHCPRCSETIDPVIVLHRLSQDPNVEIPESDERLSILIKRYVLHGKGHPIGKKVVHRKPRPAIDKIQPRPCTVCTNIFKPDHWFQRGCTAQHSEIHNHRHRVKTYLLRQGHSEEYAISRAREKYPDNWSGKEAT